MACAAPARAASWFKPAMSSSANGPSGPILALIDPSDALSLAEALASAIMLTPKAALMAAVADATAARFAAAVAESGGRPRASAADSWALALAEAVAPKLAVATPPKPARFGSGGMAGNSDASSALARS